MQRLIAFFLTALFLIGIPGVATGQSVFNDFIDIEGHWAEKDIKTVGENGIMNGLAINDQGFRVFAPEIGVNRAQLATILVRTFHLDYDQMNFIKEPVVQDYYLDVDNNAWYKDAVLVCAVNNIFAEHNYYYPDKEVSRIEVARAIQHCFEAKGLNIPMIMMMPVYEDTHDLNQQDMNAMVFVSNTGIMKGDGTYFYPNQTVKRSEMARIINRCTQLIELNENK